MASEFRTLGGVDPSQIVRIRPRPTPVERAMKVSVAFGVVMLALKVSAFLLTGSAAILGDAAESVVHLAAVGFAAFSVWFADQPADANHPYGHSKIAFISAGLEGMIIGAAAIYIVVESIRRWSQGAPVEHAGAGLILTSASVIISGGLGWYLIRTGRRESALILLSNGKHVLTDAWTSLGAVLGLVLVQLTGQFWWDPVFGLIMAANILITGYQLLRRSVGGLMDEVDSQLAGQLSVALERETRQRGVNFHALRLRDSGHICYADVHFVFADDILLQEAHRIATEIEAAVEGGMEQRVHLTTHLECAGDHEDLHPGDVKAKA